MSLGPGHHVPVMLGEMLEVLAPRDGGIYVDATFGGGGYSKAVLDAARCTLWGIDRDPEAIERGVQLERRYPGRLTVLCGRFGDMDALLDAAGVTGVDGVVLDLGVSSMQIDDPQRGFSFSADGPLDMRMDKAGMSAADVVNRLAEKDLADLIYRYGEERASRRVAHAIVQFRARGPITRTGQLADLVRGAVKRAGDGIDPATRTFQALRIHVNDEMDEIERGLSASEKLLGPGGRLAVVSFHSLEDRLVKNFLRRRGGHAPRPSRHLPPDGPVRRPSFRLLGGGAARPDEKEVAANPRARSARLRAAERTAAPSWPAGERGAP